MNTLLLKAYELQSKNPLLCLVLGWLAFAVLSGELTLASAQDIVGGSAAAGGGTPTGPEIASGGGVRLGPLIAAGGVPVNGNAVQACSRAMGYLQGGFGTLVAAAAGIGAIVAAAVGGFKAAWALMVVSIGTFVLRTFLTLFLTGC